MAKSKDREQFEKNNNNPSHVNLKSRLRVFAHHFGKDEAICRKEMKEHFQEKLPGTLEETIDGWWDKGVYPQDPKQISEGRTGNKTEFLNFWETLKTPARNFDREWLDLPLVGITGERCLMDIEELRPSVNAIYGFYSALSPYHSYYRNNQETSKKDCSRATHRAYLIWRVHSLDAGLDAVTPDALVNDVLLTSTTEHGSVLCTLFQYQGPDDDPKKFLGNALLSLKDQFFIMVTHTRESGSPEPLALVSELPQGPNKTSFGTCSGLSDIGHSPTIGIIMMENIPIKQGEELYRDQIRRIDPPHSTHAERILTALKKPNTGTALFTVDQLDCQKILRSR